MSPEQARGQAVDKRADIWAFGCVLYELLTGQRAMKGDTVSDILASVLTDEPDWSRLPRRRRLAWSPCCSCLTKDPRDRQRDIGDVRFELMEPGSDRRLARHRSPVQVRRQACCRRGGRSCHMGGSPTPYGHAPPRSRPGSIHLRSAVHTHHGFPWHGDACLDFARRQIRRVLSDRDGPMHVWLTQVGSGRFTDLTRAMPSIAYDYAVRRVGFSGDGTEVWTGATIRHVWSSHRRRATAVPEW